MPVNIERMLILFDYLDIFVRAISGQAVKANGIIVISEAMNDRTYFQPLNVARLAFAINVPVSDTVCGLRGACTGDSLLQILNAGVDNVRA